MAKSKKNNDLNYGDKDILTDKDLEDENAKIRITTFIDLDVLKKLKTIAKKEKTKYQTLLNKLLRETLFDDNIQKKFERRLRVVEKKLGVK